MFSPPQASNKCGASSTNDSNNLPVASEQILSCLTNTSKLWHKDNTTSLHSLAIGLSVSSWPGTSTSLVLASTIGAKPLHAPTCTSTSTTCGSSAPWRSPSSRATFPEDAANEFVRTIPFNLSIRARTGLAPENISNVGVPARTLGSTNRGSPLVTPSPSSPSAPPSSKQCVRTDVQHVRFDGRIRSPKRAFKRVDLPTLESPTMPKENISRMSL
mmetsp:Transcript_87490/g.245673  ORF Transcript_87490/g.245673 Transcript_87490/m.245673 type:complete len:215 (-) Transcript_87490:86-730(-)